MTSLALLFSNPLIYHIDLPLTAITHNTSQNNRKAARWNRGFLHAQSLEDKAAYVDIFPPLITGDETPGRSPASLQAKHANQAVNVALLRCLDTAD